MASTLLQQFSEPLEGGPVAEQHQPRRVVKVDPDGPAGHRPDLFIQAVMLFERLSSCALQLS
jgi:hypothetical protein